MLPGEREKRFGQWLDENTVLVLKIVRAYAEAPEDQDDLLQEILLQVWSSLPAFRGESKASTWAYKVALNTALAWRRVEGKHRRRRRPLIATLEPADPSDGASEGTRNGEMLDRLYAAIRKLPKVKRSLILLYLDGLSYREMADVLGISESNVGVRLNRLKRELADLLGGGVHGS